MPDQVVEEQLKAILSLLNDLRVILVKRTSQSLKRNVLDDAARMLHLENLDQPLEVAVSPIHHFFVFWIVFQKSFDCVLSKFSTIELKA